MQLIVLLGAELDIQMAFNRRRFLVPNFPFGIFYSVEGHRILISAVLDLRQDPERIRERLEE
jgi:hypothetical protein